MELPENLKLLIFDFDGTLHNLDMDWPAVRRAVGIHQSDEKLGDAVERFKRENDTAALQTINDMEMRATDKLNFAAQITDAIKRLQSRYALAILSRNSRQAIERMLQNSDLAGIFIVGREDVDKLKPDPQGVDIILQHFNATAGQAILIGDTSHDVLAAKNAGLASIIIGNNYQSSSGLQPTLIANDFSDLEKLFADGFGH